MVCLDFSDLLSYSYERVQGVFFVHLYRGCSYISHHDLTFSIYIDVQCSIFLCNVSFLLAIPEPRAYVKSILMTMVVVHANTHAAARPFVFDIMVKLLEILISQFYSLLGSLPRLDAQSLLLVSIYAKKKGKEKKYPKKKKKERKKEKGGGKEEEETQGG